MTVQFLNGTGIPLSLAVFLATDHYDHEDNTISATALLKPTRQLVLAKRVPPQQARADIADLVSSRMGSAIHDGIERAWKDHHVRAMKALGYPDSVITRVRINPTKEDLLREKDIIPVYLEQRAYKQVGKYLVSGKYDFVGDGRVEDYKSTTVYSWMHGNNDQKYIMQGSIYRWLNPEIITQDVMAIQFIFTDWAKIQAQTNPSYPQSRTLQKVFQLKPILDTELFVKTKLGQIDHYWNAPEQELPLCTDEDLWRKPPQWKYYKNPDKTTRSTKNFDTKQEAMQRFTEDGSVGLVKEVPGQVTACKYCPAFPVCTQKDALIASGDLIL